MRKQILFLLSFTILSTSYISAQTAGCKDGYNEVTGERCNNTITTAVPFLRIIPDARSGGMGDAGIATTPDANSIYFNASKLAFAEKDFGLSVSYTPWLKALGLKDIYLADISGYKKIGDNQAVSASLKFFSLGTINYVDQNNNSLGSGKPNEFAFTGAYSRLLSDNFAAAIAIKYIYSKIAEGSFGDIDGEIKPINTAATDISFTYKTPIDLAGFKSELLIGSAFSNLGPKVSYTDSGEKDFIPTNLGIGAGLGVDFDDVNRVNIALDINKLLVPTPSSEDTDNNGINDYKEKSVVSGIFSSFGDAPGGGSEELNELMYSVGAEYVYDQQFAVRLGYFNEHSTKGNRKFFTVGLGVKYQAVGLNFSYLAPTTNDKSPLDNTLRFSLVFDFDKNTGDLDVNDI